MGVVFIIKDDQIESPVTLSDNIPGCPLDLPPTGREEGKENMINRVCTCHQGDQAAASATGAAEVVRELDPLVNQEDTTMLTAPLTPLPAPIQPEVLPIAKMVAIKRINEGELQSTSQTTSPELLPHSCTQELDLPKV